MPDAAAGLYGALRASRSLLAPGTARWGYEALRGLFFEPGGRPGLRRRRRPFLGAFFGAKAPNRPAIALLTSSCTSSRITVTKLFRRGIPTSW